MEMPRRLRCRPPILANNYCITFNGLEEEMAEREGFEPSKGYKPLLVFKTSAFNRSATSPVSACATAHCAGSGRRIQPARRKYQEPLARMPVQICAVASK